MPPRYFKSPQAFRTWLETHHASTDELIVGYYKVGTGRPSMTWPESVDQALCFGWIDGIRRRVDDERYSIRFTPRRAGSTWSAVNIKRVAELAAQGLMQPAGTAAFARRKEAKSRIYGYEQDSAIAFSQVYEKKLRANKKAWAFFQAQAPGYRRIVIHWVMSAKREETRVRRLEALLAASAAGTRV